MTDTSPADVRTTDAPESDKLDSDTTTSSAASLPPKLIVRVAAPAEIKVAKPRSKHLLTFLVRLQTLEGARRTAEDFAATIQELGAYYNSGQSDDGKCRIENSSDIMISGPLGTAVTPCALQAKIDGALDLITDETTVLFVFVGHGAVDVNHSDTRVLELDNDLVVDRASIVAYLRGKTAARLVVFLTESCAGVSFPEKPPAKIEFGPARNLARLFDQLFVLPQGVVDIASSTFARDAVSGGVVAEELSWCPAEGGMFGRAFMDVISNPPSDLIAALDKETGNVWPELYCAVKHQTAVNYSEFRAGILDQYPTLARILDKLNGRQSEVTKLFYQATQQPQAFDLAGRTFSCEKGTP